MSDIAAALEAARIPLADLAIRALDLEKFLWVDEEFTEVAKDVVNLTKVAESKLDLLWEEGKGWGLSTLRGEALMSDLHKATTTLIKMCTTVRNTPGSAGANEMMKDSLRYHRIALSDLLNECRALRDRAGELERAGQKSTLVARPAPTPTTTTATTPTTTATTSAQQPQQPAPHPPPPPIPNRGSRVLHASPENLQQLRAAVDALDAEGKRFVGYVRDKGAKGADMATFTSHVKALLGAVKHVDQVAVEGSVVEPVNVIKENVTNAVRSAKSYLFEGQGGLARVLQSGEAIAAAVRQIRDFCGTPIVSTSSRESARTPANNNNNNNNSTTTTIMTNATAPPPAERAELQATAASISVEWKRFVLFVREVGGKASQEDQGPFMDRVRALLDMLKKLTALTATTNDQEVISAGESVKQGMSGSVRAAKSYLFDGQGELEAILKGGDAAEAALIKIREFCGESFARISPPSEIPEQAKPRKAVHAPTIDDLMSQVRALEEVFAAGEQKQAAPAATVEAPATSQPQPRVVVASSPAPAPASIPTPAPAAAVPVAAPAQQQPVLNVTERIRAEPPVPRQVVAHGDQDDELAALEGMLEEKDLYAKNRWQKPYSKQDQFQNKQEQTLAKANALKARADLQTIIPKRTSSAAELGAKAAQLREKEEQLKKEQEELELLQKEHELSLKEKELEEKEFRLAQQKRLLEQKMTSTGNVPTAGGFVILHEKKF